jgi:hypothetical protein
MNTIDRLIALHREGTLTTLEYRGNKVYLLEPGCCDRLSTLYDSNGNILGNPSGGLTGYGDGTYSNLLRDSKVIHKINFNNQHTI